MYYLGVDVGSSSIKIALVEKLTGKSVGVVQEPSEEMGMHSLKKGWAEQQPEDWWNYVCNGIDHIKKTQGISAKDIVGVGIAYQMHGLVLIDSNGNSLRKAIIWCDSRAVEIGKKAYEAIGKEKCDTKLLNAPGNFTASKLAWIKENEPERYQKVYKFMLPGDYIAYRFSNTVNTTISGLSEGIFWDFTTDQISDMVLNHYGFESDMIPEIVDTFSIQCAVSDEGARQSGLEAGTPILYRAGDQPNNALALNVFQPGEVAASAGTSGVMYAITNSLSVKEASRLNNFAHVNYRVGKEKNIGKLLCINGAGIQYRWLLNNLAVSSYEEMNQLAAEVEVGSDGVCVIPFGNGAERMLNNSDVGTHIINLNLNMHARSHLCRAALEGIAFSFVYGMDIMQADGVDPKIIRAGNDNLFRSEIFSNTIANLLDKEIEIYETTGAIGAGRACVITEMGYEAFSEYIGHDHLKTFTPIQNKAQYQKAYGNWKKELNVIINN